MVRDKESLTRLTNCCACHKFFTLMGDWCHRQCHRHHQQDDDARRTRKLAPARGGGSHSLKLHCENQPGRVGTPYKHPCNRVNPRTGGRRSFLVSFLGGNAAIIQLLLVGSFVGANNNSTHPIQVIVWMQVCVPLSFFLWIHAHWAAASKLQAAGAVPENFDALCKILVKAYL